MPAERSDARHNPIEGRHVRPPSESRQKSEAAAVHSASVEHFQFAVRYRIVYVADAAVPSATLRNRVEHHGVVTAVRRGVDDDRALDADACVHRFECRQGRFGRCVWPSFRIRIAIDGTEDVAVRVARQRRRLERRSPGCRIRSWNIGNNGQGSLKGTRLSQLYVERVRPRGLRPSFRRETGLVIEAAGLCAGSGERRARAHRSSSRRGPLCYFWRPRRDRRRIKYGMLSAMIRPIITSVNVLISSLSSGKSDRSQTSRQFAGGGPSDSLLVVISSTTTVVAFAPIIPIPVAVPTVVMYVPTATSLPITLEEQASVVACGDPPSTRVWRPGPVTVMPLVMPFDGIPVPVYPHVIGLRRRRRDVHHLRPPRRTNPDSHQNGSLSVGDRSADPDKQKCGDNRSGDRPCHAVNLRNFRSIAEKRQSETSDAHAIQD